MRTYLMKIIKIKVPGSLSSCKRFDFEVLRILALPKTNCILWLPLSGALTAAAIATIAKQFPISIGELGFCPPFCFFFGCGLVATASDPNFIAFISIYLCWFQFSVLCVDDFPSPSEKFDPFLVLGFTYFWFFGSSLCATACQFAQGQVCGCVFESFPFPVHHLLFFRLACGHITRLNFNPLKVNYILAVSPCL